MLSRARRLAEAAVAAAVAFSTALATPAHARAGAVGDDDDWESRPLPVLTQLGSSLVTAAAARRGATIIEQPARSVTEWTPAMVKAALRDADSGSLARPADLVEAMMGDDRVTGVLSTRTHGLLALPLSYYGGSKSACKALEGTRAVAQRQAEPGDWIRMFPENELAHLLAWGILLGVGLAERVFPAERATGEREVPTIRVWHPRWLRFEYTTRRWLLTTADGEIEIQPGDGKWILYLPYGSSRPWSHGAWRACAFAWVLKQFALHDRARHSEILGSATRVGVVPGSAAPEKKKAFLADLRRMGRNTSMVLPEGFDLKMVEATGRTWEIYGAQVEWADRAIAISLAGQFVTTEGTKGFSNGNIHADIKLDLIKFTAESLITCLHDQGVVPWAVDNFGKADAAPWAQFDTSPPEDKKATAEALLTIGSAITTIDGALAASGARVDARAVVDRFGVEVIDLPADVGKAPSIALAPTDLAKVVRVNEARASGGLGPLLLANGEPDPDGLLTVAAFAAKQESGAATTPPPPAGPAPPLPPAPPPEPVAPLSEAA